MVIPILKGSQSRYSQFAALLVHNRIVAIATQVPHPKNLYLCGIEVRIFLMRLKYFKAKII